jgi:phosphocarrier protein FPr/phosphocarrier protein
MEIRSPVSGVVVPLDCVPDPVFARKMVGDGVAVDPTRGEVLAPLTGTVTQLHPAHHAVAVTSEGGVEVLVHVGLDTVSLEGRGFSPLVRRGDRVQQGQVLLRFDVDAVALAARSLLTAVVVTSGDKVARLTPARGLVEAGQSVLLQLELASAAAGAPTAAPAGTTVLSVAVTLPNVSGLHARPSAVLSTEARRFASAVSLVRGEQEANAKSVVALMGLATKRGDVLRVKATGPDAQQAADTLAALLAEGCGEAAGEAPAAHAPPAPAAPRAPERRSGAGGSPNELTGAPASPGLAIGRVYQHRQAAIRVQPTGGPYEEERSRLSLAVREAARQLEALRQHATDRSRAGILGVQLSLLEDPTLVELAEAHLRQGRSAAWAWQEAYASEAAKLETLDNALLRERAADIRDVGRRLLALLAGATPERLEVPEGSILVAEELSPSEMSALEGARLLGICTTTGGSTSHLAILARAAGIPAVCGIDEGALALPDGTRVAIDGGQGVLRVSPDDAFASQVQDRIARQQAKAVAERAAAFHVARTADGHRVEVVANIRNAKDAVEAVAAGAEGVGLLRSEFLFSDRTTAPTEDEQAEAYTAVARALGPERPCVIRTLDVGGDKPLPFLPLPKEDNPFLGLRGIRVGLDRPEVLRTQLRAILRAAPHGNVHVMFPMVATLDDVRAAKEILAEEQRAIPHALKVGVMIEVPSAAVTAELLAREVDFFSIGTNDLTQYTLAMDRGHPKLAKDADSLHPAVLRMIAMTVEGAHEHGKWVGVCGGLASDELAVPLLVGLGVDELSVSVPAIAGVKATLSRWSLEGCRDLATDVLRLRTAAEVRAHLQAHAEDVGYLSTERVTP